MLSVLIAMLSVLIVEDHQAVREALTEAFLGWGHRVTAAASLDQANALTAGNSFDLMVTDVDLNGGDGLELVRTLAPLRPQAAFAQPHELRRNPATAVCRIDREAIDPSLAAVMGSEDGSDQASSIKRAQVSIAWRPQLSGHCGSALPTFRPGAQPAHPKQVYHRIVVGET